jgi:adenylate cyclase
MPFSPFPDAGNAAVGPRPPAAATGASRAAGAAPPNPVAAWLLGDGWDLATPQALVAGLAAHALSIGIPLWRLRVTLRTLHPQFFGTSYTWMRGGEGVEEYLPPHEILLEDRFLKSPFAAIFDGAGGIRERLDVDRAALPYPILDELRREGATDYVAMPLTFSDARISAITFATDRAGGFATAELETLYAALPVLSRLFELHAVRRTARNVMETYLGRHSGARVLEGRIRRGDGEDIHAVIWFSDLRASTALAEALPRPDFLAALDDYFGAVAGAVLAHGGEVLRFMGDAALAIFPIGTVTPCPERCADHLATAATAVAAAEDAMLRMAEVNHARAAQGGPVLRFGIGLHLGDVMYGNIGAPERLEFTVIGPAANEACRIETLCKTLHMPLLLSAELARLLPGRVRSLGHHVLRGIRTPRELFTLARLVE